MSATFDAVGPSSSGYALAYTGQTSGTGNWTHTVGASATLLIAWVSYDNVNSFTSLTCTANGTTMNAFAANPIANNSGGTSAGFYLFNPPTGSVTVAYSFATASNTLDEVTGGSLSFNGATALGSPTVLQNGTGSTITLTVAGVAGTSIVAGFIGFGDAFTGTTPTGTAQFEAQGTGAGGSSNGNSAGFTNTGTGSVSVGLSGLPSGDTHCGWAVEVQGTSGGIGLFPQKGQEQRRNKRKQQIWPGAYEYQAPAISPFIPSAIRESRRPPKFPRGSVATPLAGGVSQPPIPPEAVHDQRRPGQRDGTGNPPFRSSAPSWNKGVSQPPIPPTAEHAARRPPKLPPHGEAVTPEISHPPLPPEAVRDARREPRTIVRGSAAEWTQGISQPPIIPKAIRDQERQPRIPPRSNMAEWTQGISQPPIPPQAVRDTRRMFRWPWRGSTAATFQAAAAIIPAVPLPSSEHASRRPPKLPPRGIAEIKITGGVSQPPIPPQAIRDVRKPPRIPRSTAEWTQGISQPPIPPQSVRAWRRPIRFPSHQEASPPSSGFTPPVANRAPQSGQIRQRLIQLTHWKREATPTLPIVPPNYVPEALRDVRKPPRIPRSAEMQYPGAISQPPIPPAAIRDVRKPPRIPRSAVTWTKGASQPPIPPQAVHAYRRPNKIPRSMITPPFVPPPPPFPPRAITIPRHVFHWLLKRVRPAAPPGPSTFVISPGTVTITNSAVWNVILTDSPVWNVVLSDAPVWTVNISDTPVYSVIVSNSAAGRVIVGNSI